MQVISCYSVIIIVWMLSVTTSRRQKSYKGLKLGSCSEHPDLPIRITRSRLKYRRDGNTSVEFTMVIEKNIDGDIQAVASAWKCDSGSPESCEYIVKDIKMKRVCEKMLMKNQFWTPMIESIRPKLLCPFKAGTYVSKTFIHQGLLYFFSVPTGLWKTKVYLYLGDELITCTDFIFQVLENVN